MTDTNPLAPTDAQIDAIADQHKASGHGTVWPHAFARAVLAKFGAPAPAATGTLTEGRKATLAMLNSGQARPWEAGVRLYPASYSRVDADYVGVFTAAQVQAMLPAALIAPERVNAPRKVYICKSCEGVYADAPVSSCDCMPGKNEFYEGHVIFSTQPPSGPAHEPLTDEQIDEIHLASSDAYERGDVEYESHGFARAIKHHHGITAARLRLKGKP